MAVKYKVGNIIKDFEDVYEIVDISLEPAPASYKIKYLVIFQDDLKWYNYKVGETEYFDCDIIDNLKGSIKIDKSQLKTIKVLYGNN